MSTGITEVAPTSRTWSRMRGSEWLVLYALSIVIALLIAGTLVEATGGDWRPVLSALLDGSVRRPGRWGETLVIHCKSAKLAE